MCDDERRGRLTERSAKRRRIGSFAKFDSEEQLTQSDAKSVNYDELKFFALDRAFTSSSFSSIVTLEDSKKYLGVNEIEQWPNKEVWKLLKEVPDATLETIHEQCCDLLSDLQPWKKQSEIARSKLLDRVLTTLVNLYEKIELTSETPLNSVYDNTVEATDIFESDKNLEVPLLSIVELRRDAVQEDELGRLLLMLNTAGFVNWSAGYNTIETIYGIQTNLCDWIFVQYDIDTANGGLKGVKISEKITFPSLRNNYAVDKAAVELLNGILSLYEQAITQGKQEVKQFEKIGLQSLSPSNVATWIRAICPDLPDNFHQQIIERQITGTFVATMTAQQWQDLGMTEESAKVICNAVDNLQ